MVSSFCLSQFVASGSLTGTGILQVVERETLKSTAFGRNPEIIFVSKLFKPEIGDKTTAELGYPESVTSLLGTVLRACTILYMIPKTAVLGAILLTGFLGGAVATHVRVAAAEISVRLP